MLWRPEESLTQAQNIDDVAREHDRVCVNRRQEIGEFRRARALESQVDVGQK
jgi:hypothetical protein